MLRKEGSTLLHNLDTFHIWLESDITVMSNVAKGTIQFQRYNPKMNGLFWK